MAAILPKGREPPKTLKLTLCSASPSVGFSAFLSRNPLITTDSG